MQCVQAVPRDGLGLPVIVPIAISAAGAIGGLFIKKKPKITEADAKIAVRQIYLELLEREPDPGSQGFVDCLIKGSQADPSRGWCDVDFIRTEILKSPEYRELQLRKAAQVYGVAPGSSGLVPAGGVPSSALPPGNAPPGAPGTLAGIPIPLLIGGVALLMLLRK